MKVTIASIALLLLAGASAEARYTCTTHSGDGRVFSGQDEDQNVAMRKAGDACNNGGHTSRRQCYSNVSCYYEGGWRPGPGPRPGPRPTLWECSTHSNDHRVFTARSHDRNQAQQEAAQACDNGGNTSRRRCYGNVSCRPVWGWGR